MEWYYILGIISYGIFIIQFCLSLIGSDADFDIDFDGDMDITFSDIISFKGMIHFLMGFSGWLMLNEKVTPITIIIGIIIGFFFLGLLYYVYKIVLSFQHFSAKKSGVGLIGTVVTVSLIMKPVENKRCLCTLGTDELNCISEHPVKIGDKCVILGYIDGIYHIS